MDAAKGAPRTWMSECTGASVIIIVTMKHLDKLMHRNLNLKKQYLQKRAPKNGPRETGPEKRAPRNEPRETGSEKTEKREPEKENSYDRSDEIEWDENFD